MNKDSIRDCDSLRVILDLQSPPVPAYRFTPGDYVEHAKYKGSFARVVESYNHKNGAAMVLVNPVSIIEEDGNKKVAVSSTRAHMAESALKPADLDL